MPHGWRVFELQLFKDRECLEELIPSHKIMNSGYLQCGEGGFNPAYTFDKCDTSMWVSKCGQESASCDGRPKSEVVNATCNALESYIAVDFGNPEPVQCVRMLQGSAPYKSDTITISAHVGYECYHCAKQAMSLAYTTDDGYDTFIGTPGLIAEYYTGVETWAFMV